MPEFTVTHNTKEITAVERAIHVAFNNDGSLRSLIVVGAREALGGEEQRTADVSTARAVAIIQAVGGASPTQVATALRALIREGMLDAYDDSRQSPEE